MPGVRFGMLEKIYGGYVTERQTFLMVRPSSLTRESAETLAIQALSFIAENPSRLGAFLASSGIGPESIRAAAREPNFLMGVLEHIATDERLLVAFAEQHRIEPNVVARARAVLAAQVEDESS